MIMVIGTTFLCIHKVLNLNLKKMTVLNLQTIVAAGGCVVINASSYTVLNLQTIAVAGKKSGGKLHIKNANSLTVLNCQAIASANPGNVTFDFSE